jgi:hypothetical protein
MAKPRSEEKVGEVRCFGCGLEPLAGVIQRLADGSNCPTCCGRVLEEQPTLLRRSTEAGRPQAEDTPHTPYQEPLADHDAATAPVAAGRRLRHLHGGSSPDMRPAPDGHWPNEPA